MKREREFIISSEELKKNQERVLKQEAEAARIEKEEKKEHQIDIIFMCFIGIVILMLLAAVFYTNKSGMDACIEAGNSASFCRAELLR
jgi:hypothetical protein